MHALPLDYEPSNFKRGDVVTALCDEFNPYVNEEVVKDEEYSIAEYCVGNRFKKNYLRLEGCKVFWDDDTFILKENCLVVKGQTTFPDSVAVFIN